MKSIQVIASLLCGILYCGISLNAQNVLKATGWMPEHTFTSGIEGPAVDSEGNLYAVNYKKEGTIGIVRPDGSHGCFLVLPDYFRKDLPEIVSASGKMEICTWRIIQGIIS